MVAEDTLRDNFTKAQKALGMRHRSLYQAKHTYAVLALLDGESPAVVARSLGISLATLEKHYAAALQKGRTIAVETPRETPRRVAGGKNAREQKRPRRDLNPAHAAESQRFLAAEVGRMGRERVQIAHVGKVTSPIFSPRLGVRPPSIFAPKEVGRWRWGMRGQSGPRPTAGSVA
jgi:hypothetical protein